MNDYMQRKATEESEAVNFLITTLQAGRPDLPAISASGALMKASVLMARAVDNEAYPESCRGALENVLADLAAAEKPTN